MGGGDLNTKKSWHPNTIKNQERVWKAEQAAANEKKRIDDLKKEMNNERSREELQAFGERSGVLDSGSNNKLDWMYKQPNKDVNTEEYLLGKKIDKDFEKVLAESKHAEKKSQLPSKNHVEHECIPFSIRNFRGQNEVPPKESQVDMARKIQEDPLMAIKKSEQESRAKLLQNPVKLKELTRLLKAERELRKDKKAKKKSKKKKNSSDLDDKLAKKLLKLQNAKDSKIDLNNLLGSKPKSKSKKSKKKKHDSSESDDFETEETDKKSKSRKSSSKSNKRSRSYDVDSSDSEQSSKRHKHKAKKSKKKHKDYSSDNEDEDQGSKGNKKDEDRKSIKHKNRDTTDHHSDHLRKSDHSYRSESPNKHKRNYGLVSADGKKIELRRSSPPPRKEYKSSDTKNSSWKKPQRIRLSEEEKEKRRKEMLTNALERDFERERNVRKYREEERREEENFKQTKFDDAFVEKQLRKAAAVSTVQDRIKSNVNNIQRSKMSMDVNFARR